MRTRTITPTLIATLLALTAWLGSGWHETDAGFEIGRIVGTVTDDETAEPVPFVVVSAYNDAHQLVVRYPSQPDGSYELTFGPPEDVRLSFTHDEGSTYTHLDEWYEDEPDFASADVVHVEPGETQTIDVQMKRGGSISGVVTADGSGDPLHGICVTAHDRFDGTWVGRAQGGAAGGRYEVTGLLGGPYKLEFVDCLDDDYPCLPPNMRVLSEWYDDAQSMEDAQPVSVTLGDKRTVHVALAPDPSTPDPNATPTPQLTWHVNVDPPAPRVGDEVRVQAGASGNGGLPYYTMKVSPDDGRLVIEETPEGMGGGPLGATYLWRLRAARPGQVVLRLSVNYEKIGCYCNDRDTCMRPFFFTLATSPDVNIVVGVAAGDANADGPVDARDAALILQMTAGLVKALPGAPDANGDGGIDARDATLVLQLVAGLIEGLPG